MRTCFVHIGMHKAGSTAIQTAFAGYDDGKTAVLRIGKPNHTWPILMMFSSQPDYAARRSGQRINNLQSHVQGLRKTIIAQFKARQSNYVISGEGLSMGLAFDEISNLKSFLAEWFDDIRVIVYIRDPSSYMRSAFQQSAKSSAVAFSLDRFKPRYRERIADWITVFGRNNVDAVLFDRRGFDQGSVLHDFAHRIGADVARIGRPSGNESLKAEGFALTYAARGSLASGQLGSMQWVKLRADLYMSREYGKLEFDFSDDAYENALETQKDDIAWAEQLLQREFPPRARPVGAIVLGSDDDILRYAHDCRPAFDVWKRTHFGAVRRLSYLARALRHRVTSSSTSA
jgi:hypothetical protein